MSKMIKVTCGVILTINRPDGTVDRLENTRFMGQVPAATYRAMVKATKDAGRGDIVAQEPMHKLMADIEQSASDIREQAAFDFRRLVERTSANGRA